MSKILLVLGHATRVSGKVYEYPTQVLIETLNHKKISFIYIRHSIDGKALSQLIYFADGKEKISLWLPSIPVISVFRYISEFILNIFITLILKVVYTQTILIGIDPLNAIAGVISKYLGIVKTSIYYAVDYSDTRFENNILNKIYRFIDRFTTLHNDFVWNVSTRIQEMHERYGVDKNRNLFLPNVPTLSDMSGLDTQHKYSLVTVGILNKQLDFSGLFRAIKILRAKYPKIVLHVIGSGPEEMELVQDAKNLGLQNNIVFHGYLSHDLSLKVISACWVGLALYNGKWSFNYYGDSMKCREYLEFGLPIVTTNTHSTVDEIIESEVGIVCEQNAKEYASAIDKIFKNYHDFSRNAGKLGDKYRNIHSKFIENILI